MLLVIRDEADIIRENLDFHFAMGIDFAIVSDHLSRDGTREILREYEAGGRIRVIERHGVFDPTAWLNDMGRLAVHEYGADWILPNDADEFFWPRASSLRESLVDVPLGIGALACRRHNFVPTKEDGRSWWQRMTLRHRESLNARGRPLPGKLIHRAHPDLALKRGNHRQVPPQRGSTLSCDSIEVLHFQMRNYSQFERTVVRMGQARQQRAEQGRKQEGGGARAVQFELWQAGKLPDYYEEHVALESGGDLIEDTRLRDALTSLYTSASS